MDNQNIEYMKKQIELMKDKVDFANTVSTVMLAVAALVTTIAFFVVVYQVILNTNTVSKIKRENSAVIKKTLHPLIVNQLYSLSIIEQPEQFESAAVLLNLINKEFRGDSVLENLVYERYIRIRAGKVKMFFEMNMDIDFFNGWYQKPT